MFCRKLSLMVRNKKIFINRVKENWIVDRFKNEWIQNNKSIFTNNIFLSTHIWAIASWCWKPNVVYNLYNKKVISTIHHIDFEKFDINEQKKFYKKDNFVTYYHAVSEKTKLDLESITDKKIITIPFWVNNKIFFPISDKSFLKNKYLIPDDSFIVGSFQRDSEGHNVNLPKLSKGPDRLIEIFKDLNKKKKNLVVILTGRRRDYLISKLEENRIKFLFFNMTSFSELNEIYNILDLYVVASRVEGGPQAIVECAATKVPIISTDVGLASQILHKDSIFEFPKYETAIPNIEYSYENVKNLFIENWLSSFNKKLIL